MSPGAVEDGTQASSRTSSPLRYNSVHACRRILPLVVIGIAPRPTSTRSAAFTPCACEMAEVMSCLTWAKFSLTSSSVSPRFLI